MEAQQTRPDSLRKPHDVDPRQDDRLFGMYTESDVAMKQHTIDVHTYRAGEMSLIRRGHRIDKRQLLCCRQLTTLFLAV